MPDNAVADVSLARMSVSIGLLHFTYKGLAGN